MKMAYLPRECVVQIHRIAGLLEEAAGLASFGRDEANDRLRLWLAAEINLAIPLGHPMPRGP